METLKVSVNEPQHSKPEPALLYNRLQAKLLQQVQLACRPLNQVLSDVTLATTPVSTVKLAVCSSKESGPSNALPLTCIEMEMPGFTLDELVGRARRFFQLGVRSYWIVVPALRGIFVFDRPSSYKYFRDAETLRDEILGIELPLPTIFE